MKSKLDQIEAQLQTFIEKSMLLFPWGNRRNVLASQLVEALQNSLEQGNDGSLIAPSVYTIYISPDNLEIWKSQHEFIDSLAAILQNAALENGVKFEHPPIINLSSDPNLMPDEISVNTILSKPHHGHTAIISLKPEPKSEPTDPRPNNAFLIVNGETHPLRQVVINIGRKLDNHFSIDDPRVSRSHAQLRAARGHYVLFDLDSTGGTYVNGVRITQQVLKPGDVISLAGVAIIYGEDNPFTSGATDKNPPSQHISNPDETE